MTLQAALDRLKATVQSTQQLNVAWDRFFDLSLVPGFISGSHQSHLDHLPPVVNAVCKIMAANPRGDFRLPAIMQYGDSGFYHGVVDGPRRTGTFMYFKDLDMGMVALISTSSQKTDFCRFGLSMLEGSRHFAAPMPREQGPTIH